MKDNHPIPSVPQATPEDIQAITEASRDYIEGWFTADEERVRRCMHPQLVKRTIRHDLQQATWEVTDTLDAEIMTKFTRKGGGSALPENEKSYEIVLMDVFRHSASVKVASFPYMDYLHLAKFNDRWLIVNCLYEVRSGEETEP